MRPLGPQFIDQQQRRPKSLVTPIPFGAALGTSASTIYTGLTNEYLLIRHIAVENTTGGAVSLTLSQGTTAWVTAQSIAANTTAIVAGLNGMLLDAGDNLTGLGSASGLRIFGWGLRIEG